MAPVDDVKDFVNRLLNAPIPKKVEDKKPTKNFRQDQKARQEALKLVNNQLFRTS